MKIFGQDVALVPFLHVPLQRRLQTLVVMWYVSMFIAMPIASVLLFLVLLFSPLFWVALGYLAWIVYDVKVLRISSRGGRRWERLRHASIWNYMRDYFPVHLVKTADLDPARNYLMGYHPHGIMSCGAFTNFATESTGFSREFPGITPHMLTLAPNFRFPLLRGLLLWMGGCDVTKESIQYILTRKGTGNAAIIVIGGAEEALEANPGNYNLTLKNRKGFIKQALRTGASLVPTYTFGEVDLFYQADNPRGSLLRTFQETFKKIFGMSPPLFHGRGVLNYTFGLIPFRKPIHTVIGRPIPVTRSAEPDQSQIDAVHTRYMDALAQLFEDHKVQYGVSGETRLHFI